DSALGQPGNGWLDPASAWQISSDTLYKPSSDPNRPPHEPILRPASENVLNELIVANIGPYNSNQTDRRFLLRSSTDYQTFYDAEFGFRPGGQVLYLFKVVNGVSTGLGSLSWNPNLSAGYILTFSVYGTNPTTLRMTARQAATPDNIDADLSATDS